MKFDELIQKIEESISPLRSFYHITSIKNLLSILKNNSFKMSLLENEVGYHRKPILQKMSNYPYYMSMARNPSSIVLYYATDNQSVIIELNGTKLSDHGYKIVPFNFISTIPEIQFDVDELDVSSIQPREQEDRILSKKPTIENFKSYVKAFHLYGGSNLEKDINNINEIIQYGIPVYSYDSIQSLRILNPKRRKLLT